MDLKPGDVWCYREVGVLGPEVLGGGCWMSKLNEAQSRHLAGSLRAYGLGQMAGFGYAGIQAGAGRTVTISTGFLLIFEWGAILALRDVEDTQ